MHRRALPPLLALAALAACSQEEAAEQTRPRDPAVVQALNDPLMIDPDLSQRNEAAAAITVTTDMGLPVLPASAEAIDAARADAIRLAGGPDKLIGAPAVKGQLADLPKEWSPGHHLTAVGADGECLKELRTGAIFAARLPTALPVYPRGGTLAAAGSDIPGCSARAVRFATPVPQDDVLAFYWAQAKSARLLPEHLSDSQGSVIRGRSDKLAFDVRVRAVGDETLVDLATVSR